MATQTATFAVANLSSLVDAMDGASRRLRDAGVGGPGRLPSTCQIVTDTAGTITFSVTDAAGIAYSKAVTASVA